ncbi:FAD-dependent monooxygenase [Microvirga pudoricolor]|uniref:FAD-dependent monooxygenase n=1 Tax=Microvirga pudoricolor TaxID=2778729 RepID=UPI001952843D|nr:FAD-dependent monooxygenase [Microvirga pudoricolor]MBM6595994.1 FAD-dependent monooxygenase [Microvirga pudoricolor]
MDLPVAVVGAGIGGLTAALLLARSGHRVMLVERRTGFSEVGAGLQLSPNASRILLGLGLGPALRRAVGEPERVVVRAIRSGREAGRIALGAFMRERFGAPYWVVHRADLQTILLDAVRSQPAIRLVMGRMAESVTETPEGVDVSLRSDTGTRDVLRVKAVVGADGVWSRLRAALGTDEAPDFQGYVAWRATLPMQQVPPALAANETGLWLGGRGHVVHYPVAGGRLLNVVAIQRTGTPVEGWAAPGNGAELVAHYRTACLPLRDLLGRIESWLLWSLADRPATRMARGRLALLGDAAHPVLPFLAQGAALAIEDAEALADHLRRAPTIPLAFQAYEGQRLGRVARVQGEARRNGRIYHLSGPLALARNLVMGRLGPEGMTERYAWLYGYGP